MAKKNTRARKAEPVADDVIDTVVASSSSEDFSSDEEDIQMEGLEERAQKANSAGHTVNLNKESQVTTKKGGKKTGTIYIGRLPKQFQEYELKKYFAQFGTITRLRLSRNKNGASRHYAFIEFKDKPVAQIAAETMDNYLLFGHMLKVHVIDDPKDNLFTKNGITSFKEFNWRERDAKKHGAPKPLDTWKELQAKFEESKKQKFAELKELGFNYELEA